MFCHFRCPYLRSFRNCERSAVKAYTITARSCSFINCSSLTCNGFTSGSTASLCFGGALSAANSVVAVDCNFYNCSTPHVGGAIFAGIHGDFTNCTFLDCRAGLSGAIEAEGLITIRNSLFENCTAIDSGGAVSAYHVDISQTTFRRCSSSSPEVLCILITLLTRTSSRRADSNFVQAATEELLTSQLKR